MLIKLEFGEETSIREYSLRIVPPKPIYDDILGLKTLFKQEFGYGELLNSKAHLSIVSFSLDEQYEEKVLKSLQEKITTKPFEVKLDGFIIFKAAKDKESVNDSLVVYDAVNNEWTKMLKEIVEILKFETRQKKTSLSQSPTAHITISKTNSELQSKQVFDYFSKIDYSKTFMASTIEIVSRPVLKNNEKIKKNPWDRFHSFLLNK